jgi:hypothetical protein
MENVKHRGSLPKLGCEFVEIDFCPLGNLVESQLERTLQQLTSLDEVMLCKTSQRASLKVFTPQAIPSVDEVIFNRIIIGATDW